MLSSWTRAVVLFAAAALIVDAQCYCTCETLTSGRAQTPSDGCHHNKSPHESNSGCGHQHSEFGGPEIGVAKLNVPTAIPIFAVLAANVVVAAPERLHLPQADIGSPPGGRGLSPISVLRI